MRPETKIDRRPWDSQTLGDCTDSQAFSSELLNGLNERNKFRVFSHAVQISSRHDLTYTEVVTGTGIRTRLSLRL